jgi:hypothetical protein
VGFSRWEVRLRLTSASMPALPPQRMIVARQE